jgi:integrase
MASIARRPDGTYRPRFRDASGKEHARHFKRKVDAQRWLDEMTAAMVTGQYVDPAAGRVTFRDYAERWRATQVHRPTTAAHVETMLRRHVYPSLGDKRLGSVLPSDIQSLVKQLSLDLAPATVGVVHRILAGIFKAAVRDRRIVASPCEGTRLPKVHRQRIEPMTFEAVEALTAAMPERYRALVTLAAGTGLRQGEIFGLTVDRIDFLRRQLTVDRQLVTMPDRAPYLAPPKTQASVRVVPLPRSSSTPWRPISPPGRPINSSSAPSSATRSAARPSPSASGARR